MTNQDLKLVQALFETIRESLVADIVDSPQLILDAPRTCIPVSEVVAIITRRLRVYDETLKGGEDK